MRRQRGTSILLRSVTRTRRRQRGAGSYRRRPICATLGESSGQCRCSAGGGVRRWRRWRVQESPRPITIPRTRQRTRLTATATSVSPAFICRHAAAVTGPFAHSFQPARCAAMARRDAPRYAPQRTDILMQICVRCRGRRINPSSACPEPTGYRTTR